MRPALTLVALALSVGAAGSARAALIDDFADASLAEYTQYTVLDQDAARQVSFTSPAGTALVTKSANTQAEQVLFLRSDFSLGVGQILRADLSGLTDTAYLDYGIAVATSQTSIPDGAANTTLRQGYIAIYANSSQNAVKTISFDALNTQEGSGNSGNGIGLNTGNVLGLWIRHDTPTFYTVGYTTPSGDVQLNTTGTGAVSNGYDSSSVTGQFIGLYADARAAITFSTALDNLRIDAVPEPASLAACGLGALPLLRRRQI